MRNLKHVSVEKITYDLSYTYFVVDTKCKGKKFLAQSKFIAQVPGGSKFFIRIKFTNVVADDYCLRSQGINTSSFPGIPQTFFDQRRGCNVTLYQDAHSDYIPYVLLPRPGEPTLKESGRCWDDTFFDQRRDCKVTLYLDAHNNGFLMSCFPATADP